MADAASLTQGYARDAAAQALIDGPRKGVHGPFVPLLRNPLLLDRVASLGEALRFHGVLDARIRELLICVAARHVSNQFEWVMHAPLAVKAGPGGRGSTRCRCEGGAEGVKLAGTICGVSTMESASASVVRVDSPTSGPMTCAAYRPSRILSRKNIDTAERKPMR